MPMSHSVDKARYKTNKISIVFISRWLLVISLSFNFLIFQSIQKKKMFYDSLIFLIN